MRALVVYDSVFGSTEQTTCAIGDALSDAGKAKARRVADAQLLVSPEGFIVKGTEEPLREGERERAAEWGRKVASTA